MTGVQTCALPISATTWGEKMGTVTNSERRISRVRAAVSPPGQTRHDWAIAVDFAQRLEALLGSASPHPSPLPEGEGRGEGEGIRGLAELPPLPPGEGRGEGSPRPTLFPYSMNDPREGTETIWNEHRESTRGRDLDITGMSYAMLDVAAQQWPLKTGDTIGKARLYEDGIFPTTDGKAKFANTVYKPVAEPRESRYPFSLTTGRLRDQWHGMSRTGTLGRLFGHVAEPSVQMNANDMARRLLKDGDLVHVTSKRGSIVLPLQASPEIGPSQAFIAMHWGSEYLSGLSSLGEPLAGVNALTTSAYCPTSKQPELKHAAVKILKAELPWSLLAMAWLPAGESLQARELLKPLMKAFPFTSCVPFANSTPLADQNAAREGVLFRAAAHVVPPDELLVQIENLLGLTSQDVLHYADKKRGQRRTAKLTRVGDHAELTSFLLAGDTSAEAWIKTVLEGELPAQTYGRLLLSAGAKAPVAVAARGKLVCTCLNVTDRAINAHLAAAEGSDVERLATLQATLNCGTNCGSCVPELKRMVRSRKAVAPRVVIPIQQIA